MGALRDAEVERQLIADLAHYGITQAVDWSRGVQEGHCTRYLDGKLESESNLGVKSSDGELIAAGWMDFIHGGGDLPLFVFWLLLDRRIEIAYPSRAKMLARTRMVRTDTMRAR